MRFDGFRKRAGQALSRARDRFKEQGIVRGVGSIVRMLGCYPTNRIGCHYSKKFRASRRFTFQGQSYEYFYHSYNMSWRNERTVEIPIIWRMVSENRGRRILEAGNVLSHYFDFPHDVVDKYETAEGVINQDIVDFQAKEKHDLVVSISTLEHVGWEEKPREPEKLFRAIESLQNSVAPGGTLAVTVPLGLNREMDRWLREGRIRFLTQTLLKRISRANDWIEVDWPEIEGVRFGHPFLWANAILVGIWKRPPSHSRP
jgi:hypothetical protein